jgi:anti-sigma factor RsiW
MPIVGNAQVESPSQVLANAPSPIVRSTSLSGPSGATIHRQAVPITTPAITWGRKIIVRKAVSPGTRAWALMAEMLSPMHTGKMPMNATSSKALRNDVRTSGSVTASVKFPNPTNSRSLSPSHSNIESWIARRNGNSTNGTNTRNAGSTYRYGPSPRP